jgi:hypothetical protein
MSRRSQLLLGIQIALAACFALAAADGGASLHPSGVSIERLAYKRTGLLVLVAAVGSCLVSSLSLADLLRFRRKHDAGTFLFAFAIALLAVSPYANAPDTFSLNGHSPAVVMYPVFLWLGCLIVVLIRGNIQPANENER